MPSTVKFRLYHVTIHDTTTRDAIVPEFEVMILKAAWRGKKIDVKVTDSIREHPFSGEAMWSSLMTRYSSRFVQACFSGPERLERDMQEAADKTQVWLDKCEAWKASEDARIRQITHPKQEEAGKSDAPPAKNDPVRKAG
jgi:hypothetical protein